MENGFILERDSKREEKRQRRRGEIKQKNGLFELRHAHSEVSSSTKLAKTAFFRQP